MITGTKGSPSLKQKLFAFQTLDSRGIPTITAVLKTKTNTFTATVPAGTSSGVFEAVELRDGGKAFNGKGVSKACHNISRIAEKLNLSTFYLNQEKLDSFLLAIDSTPNKSKLGANTLLAISLVAAKAAAAQKNLELFQYISQLAHSAPNAMRLPIPMSNLINGGKHGAANTAIQEFMVVPIGAKSFFECVELVTEIDFALRELIIKKFGAGGTSVGYEGGFTPHVKSSIQALELIQSVIDRAGHSKKVKLALDCAASEFYNSKTSKYNFEGKPLSSSKLTDVYLSLMHDFDIFSIEDPFDQNDWHSFTEFTSVAKKQHTQVVGDDLLVTNSGRIMRGVISEACNAVILKPNQIGTVTETIEAAQIAQAANWNLVASHRSGDSEDSFLADFAVGLDCQFAKIGAPARGERTAKYNRLLMIEELYGLKLAKPRF